MDSTAGCCEGEVRGREDRETVIIFYHIIMHNIIIISFVNEF